jgi:hypothetical protein
MAGDRTAHALARIEAAAARIEAAAARRPAAVDPDLESRHQTLRSQAGAALAELDALIGSLKP